jgi:3-oxoacyl-[acyl-carrier protein] reductase
MERKDKVVLVTGAARGIGKEICLNMAKEGYDISLNYRTKTDDVEELKNKIESYGVRCCLVQGDIGSYEECEKMVKETVEVLGKVDILVNNAGITKDGLLMRMSQEDFTKVIDVNLVGTFNMTRNVIPLMVKQRSGRIISIASVVGIAGNAGQTNYAASKAGIIGFTKSLAKEVASRNILVNAIAPGFIATDMTKVLTDEQKENINNAIPLKRIGTPEDIAKAVKFLASEDSSYITGQVLHVDGGMLM